MDIFFIDRENIPIALCEQTKRSPHLGIGRTQTVGTFLIDHVLGIAIIGMYTAPSQQSNDRQNGRLFVRLMHEIFPLHIIDRKCRLNFYKIIQNVIIFVKKHTCDSYNFITKKDG